MPPVNAGIFPRALHPRYHGGMVSLLCCVQKLEAGPDCGLGGPQGLVFRPCVMEKEDLPHLWSQGSDGSQPCSLETLVLELSATRKLPKLEPSHTGISVADMVGLSTQGKEWPAWPRQHHLCEPHMVDQDWERYLGL